jgi:hypothetical protein
MPVGAKFSLRAQWNAFRFYIPLGETYGSFVFIWGGDPVSAGTLGDGNMNVSQKYKALIYD